MPPATRFPGAAVPPACNCSHPLPALATRQRHSSQIRVHQSASASETDGGWQDIMVPSVRKTDLLALTQGALQELGCLVPSDTQREIELRTPSGQPSGQKLQAHFDVATNQVSDMVLDFDACKSIVRAGNCGGVTGSSSLPLAGASVMARQVLGNQQLMDVGWTNADPVMAAYSLSLPLAAPLKASYAGLGGALSFSADSTSPGQCKVYGAATHYPTQSTDPNVTLGAAGSTTAKNLVLAP